MMAVRERAVKVMAALDRRVPSLDDFVGQSWSAWTEWAGVTAADGEQTLERRQRCSRGRLMKAPRHIFVQMKRRANHVTQTKTLPGPSAGWVTCLAPPSGSLIKRYIHHHHSSFIVKRCLVAVWSESRSRIRLPAFPLVVVETAGQ